MLISFSKFCTMGYMAGKDDAFTSGFPLYVI